MAVEARPAHCNVGDQSCILQAVFLMDDSACMLLCLYAVLLIRWFYGVSNGHKNGVFGLKREICIPKLPLSVYLAFFFV